MRLIITLSIFFFSTILTSQSTFQSYFGESIPFTECYDVITTSDGGFLVSGNTTQLGTLNVDFYVIKLDKNGKEEWSFIQDFDLGAYGDISLSAIEIDEHFIVLSSAWKIDEFATSSPMLLFLNKESGSLSHFHPIDGFDFNHLNKIVYTLDENILLFGYTKPIPNNGEPNLITLVKLNKEGEVLWINKIEEGSYFSSLPPNFRDFGIQQKNDGNLYFSAGNDIINIFKTDGNTNLIWADTSSIIGYLLSDLDLFSDGLLVAGRHFNEGGTLFKYDYNGNRIWSKVYPINDDGKFCCTINSQDEIFTAGKSDSDFVLMKMDKDGELIWTKVVEAVNPYRYYYPISIKMTEDEGVVVAGNIGYEGGGNGIFVFRLNSEGEFGDILDTASTPLFNTASIDIFPNPTTDKIRIQNQAENIEELQVTLYDIQANKIHQTIMNGQQSDIQMKHLPAGSYILELRNQKNQAYRKLIVKQ